SLLTPSDTTEIYTPSLHDALPILFRMSRNTNSCRFFKMKIFIKMRTNRQAINGLLAIVACISIVPTAICQAHTGLPVYKAFFIRSEEHTSELQSRENLVCRLLLEK